MWRDVLARCWWLLLCCRPAAADTVRARRGSTEPNYWSYSGAYGPDEGWATNYPECNERHQSPINIVDKEAVVSPEYQELTLEGFELDSSNRTSMKNTGKTVAIALRDQYFVRGAGLPGRFKAEKVEFHWGPSNASDGSEHSIDGRRFPVEMQIYMYNSDDFDSLAAALREKRSIAATAVFFQVGRRDNPAVDPIIHGLRGVVHHEKETFLEPFVLKDLLPASLRSYYRYTGSLTTPPCSEAVEWIVFSKPVHVSYKQLEAFYSIFTTEQQDHVKSVEYLRSNFRPVQTLGNRRVYKSALKDAWKTSPRDNGPTAPQATDGYRVCSSAPTNMKVQLVNSSALQVQWAGPLLTFHPPITHFLVSYSWTSLEDSYEETHVTDANHKLEAIISPVSPDVLYLFRVQALCMNDMRSDFSQSMLFRANTTRIFEGTRIVKSGMPTLSPVSSADMAPISSGSSTWTSAGLPFSFVSMATGIGPPSSGSQATVASLLTSALLAGLGFGGGVISSFPAVLHSSGRRTLHHTNAPRHDKHAIASKTVPAGAKRVVTADKRWMENTGWEEQGEEDEEEDDEDSEEEQRRNGKKAGIKAVASHNSQSQASVQEEAAAAERRRDAQMDLRHPRTQWLLPLLTASPLTFTCILLLLLVYCRKRFQRKLSCTEERRSSTQLETTDSTPSIPSIADAGEAVPVQLFVKHVSDLSSNNGRGFSDQFQEVQQCTAGLQLSALCSQHVDNKHKNRYVNISAYDHSRVKLLPVAGTASHSDYINANYVDGYNTPRAYIASQGPLKSTLEDFWRMVWEQNAATIVMITNLVEKGRRKCEQYWPSEDTEEYGAMAVTLKSSQVYACYTVRCLTLRNGSLKKAGKKGSQRNRAANQRTVLHYQYTQWPDMGVPDYTLPVLAFIRRSWSSHSPDVGPTVVHCSAGVGRTGTYIVIHSMMQQIREQSSVNVLSFLKRIRTQRNYLVQTQDQYVFIHEVLLEAILGQDMDVSVHRLQTYFSSLTAAEHGGSCTRLEQQFRSVTGCSNRKCSVAQRESNRKKNRSSVVPTDQSRVGLSPVPGVRDTDYINASFIMGYTRPEQFIVTQRPLPHTITHFWRMIWDQNVQLIVMLLAPHPPAEDECVYWPRGEEAMDCGPFTVSLVGQDRVFVSNLRHISVRHFLLQATQDDYVLEVHHFQCPDYPSPDSSVRGSLELVDVLQKEAAAGGAPTVIHDEDGGVCAASLCALLTLSQQMQFEGVVNIYRVVKMIELMRPRVFTHTHQYHFLFRALLSLSSSGRDTPPPRTAPAPPADAALVCTFENTEPGESVESLV